MLGATDWTGIAGFITSVATLIGVLIAGYLQVLARKPMSEVHAAVATPPDRKTVGTAVTEGIDTLNEVAGNVEAIKTVLNGNMKGDDPPHDAGAHPPTGG